MQIEKRIKEKQTNKERINVVGTTDHFKDRELALKKVDNTINILNIDTKTTGECRKDISTQIKFDTTRINNFGTCKIH